MIAAVHEHPAAPHQGVEFRVVRMQPYIPDFLLEPLRQAIVQGLVKLPEQRIESRIILCRAERRDLKKVPGNDEAGYQSHHGPQARHGGGGPPVGRVTSGAWSHTLGHSVSMAYVGTEHSRPGTELEIPLLGERRPATVIEDSPYDPDNRRLRM